MKSEEYNNTANKIFWAVFAIVVAAGIAYSASIGNLKQTWTSRGLYYDLSDKAKFEGDYFLRRATQVKNVWVPYGA